MHVWVLYDEEELPLAVADTLREMSETTGLTKSQLEYAQKQGKMVMVDLDEEIY